jgi:hypothetical protein
MSKKSSGGGGGVSKGNISQFFCFAAIFLLAIVWLLQIFKIGAGWIGWVQNICVLLAVGFGAYPFAYGQKSKVWVYIYWAVIIICVVALILGIAGVSI